MDLVEGGVQGVGVAVERERELHGVVVVEVGHGDTHQGQALGVDHRLRGPQEPPHGTQDRLGLRRRPRERVRPGHTCRVVEPHAQDNRATDPVGGAHAPGDAVHDRHRRGVDVLVTLRPPADGVLRADRASPAPDLHQTRVAVVGQRVQMAARRQPEHRHQRGLGQTGDFADRRDAPGVQLGGGLRPHAPQALDRQGVQEAELVVGGDDQEAVGLGHAARHLGEELGACDAHRDRQADLLAHPLPQPHRDLLRRPRHAAQATDIEERLVDGEALDQRCGVLEDGKHGLAGVGVGRHAGPDHDGVRTQSPRWAAAHRCAHAEGLGLIAGGQDHAAADDHRAAAQPRVVALLDRRVEGVEVGVQDGGLVRHRTHVRTR